MYMGTAVSRCRAHTLEIKQSCWGKWVGGWGGGWWWWWWKKRHVFRRDKKAAVKFKVSNPFLQWRATGCGRTVAATESSAYRRVLEGSSSSCHVHFLVFVFVIVVIVRATVEQRKAAVTWRVWLLFHDEESVQSFPPRDTWRSYATATRVFIMTLAARDERGERAGGPSGRKLCRVSPYAPIPPWLVVHSYVTCWRLIAVTTVIHGSPWIIGRQAIFIEQFTRSHPSFFRVPITVVIDRSQCSGGSSRAEEGNRICSIFYWQMFRVT